MEVDVKRSFFKSADSVSNKMKGDDVESTNPSENKSTGHKPVFGPPVPRSCDSDSLHSSLASVLGSFVEVAPLLRKQNATTHPTKFLGVAPCPPTPRTASVDTPGGNTKKGAFFADQQPNGSSSDKKKDEKEKTSSSSSSKSHKKHKNGSEDRSKKKKDGKSTGESSSEDKDSRKKREKSPTTGLPPLKLPSEPFTPPREDKGTDDGLINTPGVKQMVKAMQGLVATPLSKVKDEPFAYPEEISGSAAAYGKEEGRNSTAGENSSVLVKKEKIIQNSSRSSSQSKGSRHKSSKKNAQALNQLKADLELSEESSSESSDSDSEPEPARSASTKDKQSSSKHDSNSKGHTNSSKMNLACSSSEDHWTVDFFIGVPPKTGTSNSSATASTATSKGDQEYKTVNKPPENDEVKKLNSSTAHGKTSTSTNKSRHSSSSSSHHNKSKKHKRDHVQDDEKSERKSSSKKSSKSSNSTKKESSTSNKHSSSTKSCEKTEKERPTHLSLQIPPIQNGIVVESSSSGKVRRGSITDEPMAEDVQSPDSGFVDGGSPGKENVHGDGGKTGIGEFGDEKEKLNAETILQESTRLSPLLSPIPEFPPMTFGDDGEPSLMCRINLTLLDRLPPKLGKLSPLGCSVGSPFPDEDSGGVSLNSKKSLTSTTTTFKGSDKSAPVINGIPAAVSPDDLDEMPLDKRKGEKRKSRKRRKSSTEHSETDGGRKKEAEAPPEKKKSKSPTPAKQNRMGAPPKLSPIKPMLEDELMDDKRKRKAESKEKKAKERKSSKQEKKCDKTWKTANPPAIAAQPTVSNTGDVNSSLPNSVVDGAVMTSKADESPEVVTKSAKSKETTVKVQGDIAETIMEPSTSWSNRVPEPLSDNGDSALRILPPGAPTKKSQLDEELHSADFYLAKKAKPIKHEADALPSNNPLKILLYLESIMYFLMSVRALQKELKESSRPYHMAKETYELLRQVTQRFSSQVSSQRVGDSTRILVSRIGVLSLRAQAVICYKLYSMRQAQTFSNYRSISEYQERQKQNGNSGMAGSSQHCDGGCPPPSNHTSSTPSPASSTGSSANCLPPGHVAVPQKIEMLYKQQLNYLHFLMLAHRHWEAAEEHMRPDDRDLFAHLERICPCKLESSWEELCSYLLTAVEWLKRLHPPNN